MNINIYSLYRLMLTKEEWGNATWYLFHTLAYKLKDDHSDILPLIIDYIITICNQLPCPDCKEHAQRYLKIRNIKNVKSKNELIEYLFNFHNVVNNNLNKPIFSLEQSNELYNRAKTDYIIKYFINTMNKSTGNVNLMMNSFARQSISDKLIYFMKNYRNAFN